MPDYLDMAKEIAIPDKNNPIKDQRSFWHGCVGIRNDGTIVRGKNGAASIQDGYYHMIPGAHAEGRVLRKLGKNGTLYVARVSRRTGEYVMSRPCDMCRVRIKSFGVKKVYYSINQNQYGVWDPKSDTDKVFNL